MDTRTPVWGQAVPTGGVICPKCGVLNSESNLFCMTCGTQLTANGPASVNPALDGPAADLAALQGTQAALLTHVYALDKQVADLANKQERSRAEPWFRNASVLIAFCAFVFSLGTTLFSYYQGQQQEQHNARVELRAVIQRLSAIQRDFATNQAAYSDPSQINILQTLSGALQAENILLAKQAMEIARILPDQVTASEYTLVATALSSSGLTDESLQALDKAESVIHDANDGVTVYRLKGWTYFSQGRLTEGRDYYDRALHIYDRFPTMVASTESYINGETEINWAGAEYSQRQCVEARLHADNAGKEIDSLLAANPAMATDPVIMRLQQRITDMNALLATCNG